MFNPIENSFFGEKGRAVALVAAMLVAQAVVIEARAAEAGNWVITSAQGEVSVNGEAATGRLLTIGRGAVIETGPDGTVTLTRPGDSITVFPNSKMSLPDRDDVSEPGVLQTFGMLLFRMESRESRDFRIDTPYLAAAIKGTIFTVEVGDDDAAVEVSEGSVLVAANRSGHSAYVGPRERARVGAEDRDSVQVSRAGFGTQKDRPKSFEEDKTGPAASSGGGAADSSIGGAADSSIGGAADSSIGGAADSSIGGSADGSR